MKSFWFMLMLIFYPSIIPITVTLIRLIIVSVKLKKSQYNAISGNGLFRTFFSKGNYGEFLIFAQLEKMGESKILTNIYLPLEDDTTTEVDLILVNCYGIFVFESKNYSGWIFGDEKNKKWTQSLKGGKKNKYFNPIWQNKGHISAIDAYLDKQYTNAFYSYIVFSERCSLKKITIKSDNVSVIKRNMLINELGDYMTFTPPKLTQEETQLIYEKLKANTLANKETKKKHIAEVKAKHNL
ncbi:MAG: nuclease-related domain-containing protein [Eubacteriales bacterium]|nr:nuclease-related domain-containing protein [Eubacteriales bacterium]MDD4475180.1 nuclease-related domain-containing protein [Eubacteriales bacterium]